MANRILVIQTSVSKSLLDELSIRTYNCDPLMVAPEEEGGEQVEIPCWEITPTGVEKLRGCGLTVTIIPDRDGQLGGRDLAQLDNPDGTYATHDVDPRTIKIVRCGNWRGRVNRSDVEAALRDILIPVCDRNIQLNTPGGNRADVSTDSGWFHVHVFSSPNIGDAYNMPNTVLGVDNTWHGRAFGSPWLGGYPLVDPDTGFEWGAYDAQNMFIYGDVLGSNDTQALEMFKKMLEQVAQYYHNPQVPEPEVVKANFIAACKRRGEIQRQQAKDSIQACTAEIEAAQATLVRATHKRQTDIAMLSGIDEFEKQLAQKLDTEFQSILDLDKVESVSWRGNALTVTTKNLYCIDHQEVPNDHPDLRKWELTGSGPIVYDIGCFSISLDTTTSHLSWNNLTRRVDSFHDGMHAPHIFPGGIPCWGNMSQVIPKLVGDCQLAVAVTMAIAFPEEVNKDDAAGEKITKWPVDVEKTMALRQGTPWSEICEAVYAVSDAAETEPENEATEEVVVEAAE